MVENLETSLGVALLDGHGIYNYPKNYGQKNSSLGPDYKPKDHHHAFVNAGLKYKHMNQQTYITMSLKAIFDG
ncbi:MAG: hypothetical protein ABFS18_00820 [Thermodesulfobacteriota bacterium]